MTLRILFLRHPMQNIGGTGIFTMQILKGLAETNVEIGLWPDVNNLYKLQFTQLKIRLYALEESINPTDWDVVIIQNQFVFQAGKALLAKLIGLPHIFISHSSSWREQVQLYPSLSKVLCVAGALTRHFVNWGMPEEMVGVVDNPVRLDPKPYKPKPEKPYQLVCISRLSNDRLEPLRKMIVACNRFQDVELNIVGGGNIQALARLANDNIHFHGAKDDPYPYIHKADMVLGSGRVALEAMACSRPVIVVGARGLGGLVTPDNFLDMRYRMFAGRDGGDLHERIDSGQLHDEIEKTVDQKGIENLLAANLDLVRKFYGLDNVVAHLKSILEDVVLTHRSLNKNGLMVELCPQFSQSFEILPGQPNSRFQIKNIATGHHVLTIDSHICNLLKAMDGYKTTKELFGIFKRRRLLPITSDPLGNMERFQAFLCQLWEHRIIVWQRS